MGYLADIGQTLNFTDSLSLIDYIKKHGIIQFLLLYKKFKDTQQEEIFWGDEIEYHLLNLDSTTKTPRLQTNTEEFFSNCTSEKFNLQTEFGSWMIETVPNDPYKYDGNPLPVLENMASRRIKIQSMCQGGDMLFSGTVFPLLGVGDYFVPKTGSEDHSRNHKNLLEEEKVDYCKLNPLSHSQFVHDETISCHPRFITNTENIRLRRGEKISLLAPIYHDKNTSFEPTENEPYPGFIYMDALHFGMGSGCLQLTFGTKNIDDARYLADQMAVISSIMLPLSAATSIYKGKLADTDVRWNINSGSVDCRNSLERDPKSPHYISKSRYSSISKFISNRPQCKEGYNDISFPVNEEIIQFAKEKAKELDIEIDEQLLQHLGVLFIRDPLVIFPDKIYVDDSCNTNHFENIQSTNWNSIRFKPPPSFNSEVGWRVELRTPENQLTTEENVAFAMFSYFIAAMIQKKNYNFYIPISKVDENIERGHKRDAILKEKFWFRKNVEKDSEDEWVELTIDEILHGKTDVFVGLMNLVYDFCRDEYGVNIYEEWAKLKRENKNIQTENKIVENMKYFEILSKRARGEIPTIAAWIRNFVLKHPRYQKDSIVTKEIAFDLINAMNQIFHCEKKYEDFMGINQ